MLPGAQFSSGAPASVVGVRSGGTVVGMAVVGAAAVGAAVVGGAGSVWAPAGPATTSVSATANAAARASAAAVIPPGRGVRWGPGAGWGRRGVATVSGRLDGIGAGVRLDQGGKLVVAGEQPAGR